MVNIEETMDAESRLRQRIRNLERLVREQGATAAALAERIERLEETREEVRKEDKPIVGGGYMAR